MDHIDSLKKTIILTTEEYKKSRAKCRKRININMGFQLLGHTIFLILCATFLISYYLYNVEIKEYSPHIILTAMIVLFLFCVLPSWIMMRSNDLRKIERYTRGIKELRYLHDFVSVENCATIQHCFDHITAEV